MNPARHQRICAEIQEAHQKEIEKMTAELEATKKAVQQNYFRVVEVTVERDALRAEAGDLTVQQRNSYQKGHNAGVAHHKEATKALRLAAQAERDALAADAARYRFVRSNGLVRVQVDVDFMNAWGEYSHEALDAAIDAAIQGAGE